MDTPTMKHLVEERENLKRTLEECLEVHDNSRRVVQDKLSEICEGLRKQIDEFENKTNHELEDKFNKEDSRLQNTLNELRDIDMDKLNDNNINKLQQAIQRAKAELLVIQSYGITDCQNEILKEEDDNKGPALKKIKAETGLIFNITNKWELKVNRKFRPKMLNIINPKDIHIISNINGKVSIQFTLLNTDEKRVISEHNLTNRIEYKCLLSKKESDVNDDQNCNEYSLNETDGCFTFTPDFLEAETTYEIRVKAVLCGKESEWSDETAEFTTPTFREYCGWKECPDYIKNTRKYSVDENNHRIASKINYGCSTIIGSTLLPLNKTTLWNIKILKSRNNSGYGIFIGVAPFDIDQDKRDNYNTCGWYIHCDNSTLWSGPPHNYRNKKYGPRKENGQYVHIGDSVGVAMDTTKGDLSFVLNGVNYGVAFEGIPLDKPLVPCVIFYNNDDSVELTAFPEMKENEDTSILVPSNITTKSGDTWDSIIITWGVVEGAEFYQIEVDGSKFLDVSTTNYFTERGFLPETEHSFKVRAVKNDSVGEWSDVVKGQTPKVSFESSWWKECPDDVILNKKYSVDEENPRIVTKNYSIYCYFCKIIGNASLPLNKVTSWNIKILKSEVNNGYDIYVGVALPDVNQNEDNFSNSGWYLHCYDSALYSGPPHDYDAKVYGPRKEKGEYFHTGDSVGVVMDTTTGNLSFVLNGVNYGVAYEKIPLDKPLVPCVILKNSGDSVEFITK